MAELRSYTITNLVHTSAYLPPSHKDNITKLYLQENQLKIKGVYKSGQESRKYQCRESFGGLRDIVFHTEIMYQQGEA